MRAEARGRRGGALGGSWWRGGCALARHRVVPTHRTGVVEVDARGGDHARHRKQGSRRLDACETSSARCRRGGLLRIRTKELKHGERERSRRATEEAEPHKSSRADARLIKGREERRRHTGEAALRLIRIVRFVRVRDPNLVCLHPAVARPTHAAQAIGMDRRSDRQAELQPRLVGGGRNDAAAFDS